MEKRFLVLWALSLAACSEGSLSFLHTLKMASGEQAVAAVDTAKLDPGMRYLRISHDGGLALMLLNFVDRHPNGPVEVWYSADAEVFRFQNGRLGGNTGFKPEWRSVVLPKFPAWSELAKQSAPVHWQRYRDVMPGYRFGVRDKLTVYPIPVPKTSGLIGVDPASLTWFEERTEPGSGEPLPPARYAVRGDTVVYGEQCVSPKSCFRWQRWPAGS